MSVLEFENTQGIMLRYNSASVLHRAAAYLIDIIILGLIIFIVSLTPAGRSDMVVFAILAPIFVFYSLSMEVFNNGRSLGKMALGLKVVRIDGRPPSGYDYLMRWMFRWVDIYMSLGSVAAMLVAATPRGQRIGDLLADTTVIHTRSLRVPLKRIQSLEQLAVYRPQYPQANRLSEEQVLLAKETLGRSVRFKNEAHKEVLERMADRLAVLLEVQRPQNTALFVQTVIKETMCR